MRKICPKCKGNGHHKEPTEITDILLAPITLGISLMKTDVRCKVCDGDGYLEDK